MTIGPDDERPVGPADDEFEILPDQTGDDTDAGWGDWRSAETDDDTARLLAERPPHW